jgi:hypothetical protein
MDSFSKTLMLAVTCKWRPFTCDVMELLTFKQPLNSVKSSLHEEQQQTPCQIAHTPNVNLIIVHPQSSLVTSKH